jgi:O-antigen ligase
MKALVTRKQSLWAVLIAASCSLLAARGVSVLDTNQELGLALILCSLLPAGIWAMLSIKSILGFWTSLLPLLYLRNDDIIQVGWMGIFVVFFMIEFFGGKIEKRFSVGEQLHLTGIAAFALMGFSRSNHGPEALYMLIGSYLLPLVVYVGIRVAPNVSQIEKLLPRGFVLVYAVIGVGSLLFKLSNPSADRVASFIQLSVTMIGYSSAALVPLALYYLASSRKVLMESAVFLLLMMTLLLTNTRMALPMMAVALYTGRAHLKRFLLPAILIGAFIAIAGAGLVFTRYSNIAETGVDISLLGRLIAWNAGFKLMAAHPLFGIGLGQFGEEYLKITAFPLLRLLHGHNVLLQLSADLGIPGALVYLSYIGRRLLVGFRATRDGLGRALFWAVSIYLIAGAIESIFFRPEWTLFYWALLACLDRHVDQQAEDEAAEAAVPAPTAG